MGSRPSTTDALPVEFAWAGGDAERVRSWLEHTLGWQTVDAATAAVVPPACAVTDLDSAAAVATRPLVVLVRAEDATVRALERVAATRPDAVVAWPEERDRLAAVVDDLVADVGGATRIGAAVDLRVGGAAGGVGTTTVALAVAGIAAWSGRAALAVTHGAVPAPAERVLRSDDLAGAGTWRAATPAPGVPGLRVVRTEGPAPHAVVDGGDAELVVRDVGVGADVDVLVIRRDAAGIAALGETTAGVVVVTDLGVAPRPAIAAAAAGRRVIEVPLTVRVGRAGLAGRVPGSLPGAWLRLLRPVLARP